MHRVTAATEEYTEILSIIALFSVLLGTWLHVHGHTVWDKKPVSAEMQSVADPV